MEALVDFWSLVEVTPLPEYCERLVGPNVLSKLVYCSDFTLTIRKPSPVSIDIDEVANDQPVVVEDDNNNNNNSELEINDKTTSYTTDDLLSFAMEAMLEEEKVVVPLPSQKVEQEDKIPERIYHLHRSILWVRTGYFRTLLDIGQGFSEHNTDKFTLIFDDPCNVATALFDYIYTGQIQIAIPDLGDFYALADLLQVNDLPQQIINQAKTLDLCSLVRFAQRIIKKGYANICDRDLVLARVDEWRTWDCIDFIAIDIAEELLYEGMLNDALALYRLAERIVRHYWPEGYDESAKDRFRELLFRVNMPICYSSLDDDNDAAKINTENTNEDNEDDNNGTFYTNYLFDELEQEFIRISNEDLVEAKKIEGIWHLVPLAKLDAAFLMASLLNTYIPRNYVLSAIQWRASCAESTGRKPTYKYFEPLRTIKVSVPLPEDYIPSIEVEDTNTKTTEPAVDTAVLFMPGINKLWQMQKLHHQQQAAVAVKLLEFTTTTQLFYEFPRDTPYTDIQLRDTANDDQLISTHRVLLHLRCPDTLKSLNLRQMNTYLRDVPLLLLPGALDNALSWVYSGTPQPAINNNSFIDLRELFAFLGYTPGLIAIKEFFQKLTSFAAWQIIHQTVKRGNLPHTSFKALESICTKNLDWLPYYRDELPALRPIVQRLVLTELKSRKCQTDWYIRQHIMTLVHLWYPQYRRSPDAWQRALTAMGLAGEITHDTTSTQEERELESLYAICLHELSLEGLNTMLYDESVPIGPVLRAIAYRSQQFDDCIPQLDLS